jgi:hypothetical protein
VHLFAQRKQSTNLRYSRAPELPDNPRLTGLAFEIEDLLSLQAWAGAHNFLMAVELDHGIDGSEYEEMVAIYERASRTLRWHIWRSPDELITIQPMLGRGRCFVSVGDAIEVLSACTT